MPNLFLWLLAAAWPIAKKVLVMLGIGMVTYASVTTLVNSVVAQAQANWGQVSGAVLQLSSLGGIPEVLGIITGALVARASFVVLGRLTKIAS